MSINIEARKLLDGCVLMEEDILADDSLDDRLSDTVSLNSPART